MVVGTPWPGGYVPGSLGAGLFAPALWEAACEGAWKPMHLAPVCVNESVICVILAMYYDHMVHRRPPHHAQQLQ